MEAWYEDDWHLYDPDLEVVPLVENNHVLSLDELARMPKQTEYFYLNRDNKGAAKFVDIIGSREDNSFVLYWMVEKNLTYRIEKIANVIKWVFPMILLVIGFGFYFRKTRIDECAA